MTTDLESSLRDAFRHGADGLPHAVDPWTRTTTAVRRSQVRRRTAALAVAASVLVVGVGALATGLPSLRADGQVARPTEAADVQVTTDDVTTWPTRGALAGSTDFVTAAREALGRDGSQVGRLLFAGPVGSSRAALAVVTTSDEGGQVEEVRAAVEPSVPSADWQTMGYPTNLVQGWVSLALQDETGAVDLLVLSRTDTRAVAYSRAAAYDDQGRPQRSYVRLAPRDGVATARLEPGPLATLSVRVDRASSSAAPGPVQLASTRLTEQDVAPQVLDSVAQDPACTGAVDGTDVRNGTRDTWANRDPMNPPAAVEAIWCRDVDGGVVGLFGVTLQDGSTFQAHLLEARTGGGTAIVSNVGRPVPRGAARTTPVVLRDIPRDGADSVLHYFVHAPGAARVDVVVDSGAGPEVLARVRPDRDGFAEIRLTDAQGQGVVGAAAADAVLRDGSGREVGRVSLQTAEQGQELDWSVDGPIS